MHHSSVAEYSTSTCSFEQIAALSNVYSCRECIFLPSTSVIEEEKLVQCVCLCVLTTIELSDPLGHIPSPGAASNVKTTHNLMFICWWSCLCCYGWCVHQVGAL